MPSALEAKPGFNRWHIPPAALAIHLTIGRTGWPPEQRLGGRGLGLVEIPSPRRYDLPREATAVAYAETGANLKPDPCRQ